MVDVISTLCFSDERFSLDIPLKIFGIQAMHILATENALSEVRYLFSGYIEVYFSNPSGCYVRLNVPPSVCLDNSSAAWILHTCFHILQTDIVKMFLNLTICS